MTLTDIPDRSTRSLPILTPARRVLLIKVAAAVVTYGFLITLARLTTPQTFGQVAFFLNLSLLLSVFGACGQQMAMLRFVPSLGAAAIDNLRRSATRMAVAGACVAALLTITAITGAKHLGLLAEFDYPTILLGCALVPLVGWIDIQSHVARAIGKIQFSLIPKDLCWRLLTAILLISATSFGWQMSVHTVLAALATTLLFIGVAMAVIMKKPIANFRAQAPNATLSSDIWRKSILPFWVSSVSNIFLANADVVLVGLVVGSEQAAYYFAANRIAQLLAFFVTSHNIVLAPSVSRDWAKNNRGNVTRTLQEAARKSTATTMIFGVLLIAAAPFALQIFGPGFTQATPTLHLLIMAAVLNAVGGPADIALNMCGQEKPAMYLSVCTVLVSGITLLVGAILWGGIGVAAAVLLSTAIRKLAFWQLTRHRLGIRTDALARHV